MGLNGNQVTQYSSGAIWLHWLIAFALAAEIAIGFTMPKDASGFALFQLHKSIGITILILTVVRIGWRLTHERPAKVEGGLTGFLASAVHVLFYAFMILAPLTGWAVVSSAELDVPTLLFGVVPWPHLPIAQSLNHTIEEAHELLAFLGLGLFVLHVVGALRHHIARGDDFIGRMSPSRTGAMGLLLGAGVIVLGAAAFFWLSAAFPKGERPAPVEQVAVIDEAPAEIDPTEEGVEEATEEEAVEDEAVEEEPTEEEEAAEAAEPEPQPVAAAAPPPTWAIQPGGTLRFSVASGDMQMNGSFGQWGGRIVMNPDDPSTAQLSIDVQLSSATMNDATQDQMLRGADFLAASANPTATWRSTSVTSLGGGRYRAEGTLSLKGASRAQAITFTLSGSGNSRSVTGQAVIDRNAFSVGVGSNAAGLGGNVTLNFAFSATS